jgi:hypothetical protein
VVAPAQSAWARLRCWWTTGHQDEFIKTEIEDGFAEPVEVRVYRCVHCGRTRKEPAR